MKPVAWYQWAYLFGVFAPCAIVIACANRTFLACLAIGLGIVGVRLLVFHASSDFEPSPFRRRPYQRLNPDAGHWKDAPVAELDKSTVGKLLTSRLGRDPGLNVVVGRTTPTPCSDVLYDPELDGFRTIDVKRPEDL